MSPTHDVGFVKTAWVHHDFDLHNALIFISSLQQDVLLYCTRARLSVCAQLVGTRVSLRVIVRG